MKEKDPFGRARVDGILNALSEGKTSNDDLKKAAEKAEIRAIEDVGLASERRFDCHARKVSFIECVQDAIPYEDAFRGIDRWVRFREYMALPDLPAQIKSSYKDVLSFRNNPKYKERRGMIIVINCGPSITHKEYLKQLSDEAERIKVSLRNDPSLGRFIPRR